MQILDFKLLYTLVYKTHFLSCNFSLDIGVRLTHAIGIVQVYYGFSVYAKPFPFFTGHCERQVPNFYLFHLVSQFNWPCYVF